MATIWGSANVAPNAAYRFPVDVSAVGTPAHVVINDLVTFVQESGYGVNSLGNLTGSKTIEFENGLYARGTVTGNVTVSFSTVPVGASVLTLELTNGGAFIITWPGTVSWTSGTAPTLRTSGKDIIRFYTFDDGASFLGELAYDEQSFQAAIQWQEEGSNLGAAGTVDTVNFVGSNVTAARAGNTVTITLTGTPSGTASGDLGGTYPNPTVTQARGLRETAGPTTLAMGAVADGEYLRRSGTSVIGGTPSGGGSPAGSATEIQYRNGSSFGAVPGSAVDTTNNRVSFGAGSSPAATVHVQCDSSTEIALIAQGTSGQTAAVQEWRNSAGTVVGSMTVSGFQPTSLTSVIFVNDGGALGVQTSGTVHWYWSGDEYNGYGRGRILAHIKNVATRATSGGLANNFSSESGGTVTNTGATARVDCDLPERTGYTVDVYIDDADGMRMTCAAGDKIRCVDKETSTGGYLQSTTLGSFVRLQRIKAGQWAVLAIGGVWTDGTFTFDNTADTTP